MSKDAWTGLTIAGLLFSLFAAVFCDTWSWAVCTIVAVVCQGIRVTIREEERDG